MNKRDDETERRRLPNIGANHGGSCRCRSTLTVDYLDLRGSTASRLRIVLTEARLPMTLGALWQAETRGLIYLLGRAPANAIVDSVESLARKPCPSARETDPPSVGWRTYTRPGLTTAAERWPDDWDGVEWALWIERRLDTEAVVPSLIGMSDALGLVAQQVDAVQRADAEFAYLALVNRPWEWSDPRQDLASQIDPDDWDIDGFIRVLAMTRSSRFPISAGSPEVRRIGDLLHRSREEVLAFARYVSACDAGEITADPIALATITLFPRDESDALARRVEMMDSLEPGPPDDEFEADPDLLDVLEPPLDLPAPRRVSPEDGGPDPLSVVRDLLPGGRGTRGLPPIVYTPTALDRVLLPELLGRKPTLVVLSGNAGDGKTAFIANVLRTSRSPFRADVNEYDVALGGRPYRIILDGSEDTETRTNDDLLADALGPFDGKEPVAAGRGTLIAINKGRLLNFLEAKRARFEFLWEVAANHFLGRGDPIAHDYIFIDLNERSSFAPDEKSSIFGGIVEKLSGWEGWIEDCDRCDAKEQCPVLFNIRMLRNPSVQARLWTVLAAVDLDDRVHVTARHLVTKLAAAVVGDARCPDIRERVRNGEMSGPDSYLYNSVFSASDSELRSEAVVMDRVTSSYDPTELGTPRKDRQIAFAVLRGALSTVTEGHDGPDLAELEDEATALARTTIDQTPAPGVPEYRLRVLELVRQVSRRLFLLDPDSPFAPEFPLRTFDNFIRLSAGDRPLAEALPPLIQDLNATLGIDRDRIGELVAPRDYARGLQGTGFAALIPAARFSIRHGTALGGPYVERSYLESWPRSIVVVATDLDETTVASISIPLLMFEIVDRAGRGFRPTSQTERAFMVRLNAFYRALSEHNWTQKSAYVLYENGRILGKARLGASEMVFAEV